MCTGLRRARRELAALSAPFGIPVAPGLQPAARLRGRQLYESRATQLPGQSSEAAHVWPGTYCSRARCVRGCLCESVSVSLSSSLGLAVWPYLPAGKQVCVSFPRKRMCPQIVTDSACFWVGSFLCGQVVSLTQCQAAWWGQLLAWLLLSTLSGLHGPTKSYSSSGIGSSERTSHPMARWSPWGKALSLCLGCVTRRSTLWPPADRGGSGDLARSCGRCTKGVLQYIPHGGERW